MDILIYGFGKRMTCTFCEARHEPADNKPLVALTDIFGASREVPASVCLKCLRRIGMGTKRRFGMGTKSKSMSK